jgi:hypothetical protein
VTVIVVAAGANQAFTRPVQPVATEPVEGSTQEMCGDHRLQASTSVSSACTRWVGAAMVRSEVIIWGST